MSQAMIVHGRMPRAGSVVERGPSVPRSDTSAAPTSEFSPSPSPIAEERTESVFLFSSADPKRGSPSAWEIASHIMAQLFS